MALSLMLVDRIIYEELNYLTCYRFKIIILCIYSTRVFELVLLASNGFLTLSYDVANQLSNCDIN